MLPATKQIQQIQKTEEILTQPYFGTSRGIEVLSHLLTHPDFLLALRGLPTSITYLIIKDEKETFKPLCDFLANEDHDVVSATRIAIYFKILDFNHSAKAYTIKKRLWEMVAQNYSKLDLDNFIIDENFLSILKDLPITKLYLDCNHLKTLTRNEFNLLIATTRNSITLKKLHITNNSKQYYEISNERMDGLINAIEANSYLTSIYFDPFYTPKNPSALCSELWSNKKRRDRFKYVIDRNQLYKKMLEITLSNTNNIKITDHLLPKIYTSFSEILSHIEKAIKYDLYDDTENNKKDISETLSLPTKNGDLIKKHESDRKKLLDLWWKTIQSIQENHPAMAIEMMKKIPAYDENFKEARLQIFLHEYERFHISGKNQIQAFLRALHHLVDHQTIDSKYKFTSLHLPNDASAQTRFDFILTTIINGKAPTYPTLLKPEKRLELVNTLKPVLDELNRGHRILAKAFNKGRLLSDKAMENIIVFTEQENYYFYQPNLHKYWEEIELISQRGTKFLFSTKELINIEEFAKKCFDKEMINAARLLKKFQHESNSTHYNKNYDSINTFCNKAMDILLSSQSMAEKETLLRKVAQKQFQHSDQNYRLLKDALMVISFIFLGAGLFYGLYRKYHDKTTFFFSTKPTKRYLRLDTILKGPSIVL